MLLLASAPAAGADVAASPQVQTELRRLAEGEFGTYYTYGGAPLWVTSDGSLSAASGELLGLLRSAQNDGLDPARFAGPDLEAAIQRAQTERTPETIAKAELLLSKAFVAYVSALQAPGDRTMAFEHKVLEPTPGGAYHTLLGASNAPSLAEYLHDMRWMHPLYAPLRRSIAAGGGSSAAPQIARANLLRIRNIPARPAGRHIVVDAASARLWMYEGNTVVGSMKVVVGKPDLQTPELAGYVRHAIVNPYWNVPDNLIRKTIAKNVLAQGVKYLKVRHYEVLSGWDDDARIIDPATIDWRAVKAGELDIRVRQKPGGTNSMGKVKFEFPNPTGIYLHDTPEKQYMLKDDRHLSNGCIRLEDADRLGRWLLGRPVATGSSEPEQTVALPAPVPIYITYLTARVEGETVASAADVYGRDASAPTGLALNAS
jgi:murein L,D-transpeptidase YcbB/YkuD